MNKNRFRKVFSKRLGMLVAVGEDAKGQGKGLGAGAGGGAVGIPVVSGIKSVVLAIVLALAETTAFAQSLPTGGQYTAGSGSISTNGNTLTVDQNTQRGVINWNTFNVGAGNTVQFNQPNAQSKTLNIVSGGVPSNIQGSLLANGQIFIQNSSGILFGKGAVVNVGSLLATTKAIDPNVFMNGDVLTLSSTGKSGLVQNDGNIQAAGFVTLVGDQVRNTGSITVPGGQVVLAAGDSATVALANGQGLSLTLTDATAGALVENSGQIVADNGSVLLTARGSDTLLKTVINMSGVVQAGSGAIVADAGSTGDVIVTGKLDASNMSAGGVGGDVVLSGNRIGLSDTARIDVSGDGDAGYAVIGGDTLHKVPGTKAAALIDSVTFADAVQIDRGAQIMARSVHGDGGFLETSGRYLSMQGQVDASAPNGKNGSWLIDPTDVTISADPDANSTVDTANGTFTWNSGSATATVNNISLINALNNGTDVTITTASDGPATGNISVKADIVTDSAQSANLTLLANNSLYIGDQTDVRIGADGGGVLNVNMVATNGTAYVGSADHTVTFDTKGNVSITGGSETSGAVGLQLAGNVNVVSGNVALTGTSGSKYGVNELANSALNVTGGRLNINGTSGAKAGVGVNIANLTVGGDAKVVVQGTVTSPGSTQAAQYGVNANSITLSGNGSIDLSGNVTTNGIGVNASSVTVSENGSMTLSGIGGDGTTGVNLGDINVSGGSMKVYGAGSVDVSNSYAVQLSGNVSVSGNGRVAVIGEEAGNGNGQRPAAGVGVIANVAVAVSGNGSLTVDGSVTSNASGVVFSGRLDVSNNGQVVINGATDVPQAAGVYVTGGGSVSDNGKISINGSNPQGGNSLQGATFPGVAKVGGVVIGKGGWNISGNGALNVIGGSGNGVGVNFAAPVNVAENGLLSVSGNSTNGTGTQMGGALNVSGSGTVDISGSTTNGTGTQINSRIDVTDNGAANIAGTSVDGNGTVIHAPANVSGSGTLTISGNSANSTGTLVDLNGSIGTTDNGATNIKGNSTDGAGVLINGTMNISGSSTLDISGNSVNSTGTLVDANGSVSTTDRGATSIKGNSTDGTGVFIDGAVNVSGSAWGSVSGNSASGTSVVQGGNGAITASDDSTLNITAPGASKDDFNVGQSGNAKVNIDTSIPDNNGNTTPVDPTNPTDPTDPTNNTPGDGGVTNPTGGVSGGGHNYTGAVVGGVLGAAGIGALVMSTHAVVYLAQPAALSVESGDLTYWGKVSLEHLQIDLKGGQAELVLHAPDGPLKRQLKLLDGADGVKHYTFVDPDVGMKSDLTFNPKTSEYFYTESSTKAGRAYTVSAHGWLKERTSFGAPATLPDAAARATQALQASSMAK